MAGFFVDFDVGEGVSGAQIGTGVTKFDIAGGESVFRLGEDGKSSDKRGIRGEVFHKTRHLFIHDEGRHRLVTFVLAV